MQVFFLMSCIAKFETQQTGRTRTKFSITLNGLGYFKPINDLLRTWHRRPSAAPLRRTHLGSPSGRDFIFHYGEEELWLALPRWADPIILRDEQTE